jgi:hypothetical protein
VKLLWRSLSSGFVLEFNEGRDGGAVTPRPILFETFLYSKKGFDVSVTDNGTQSSSWENEVGPSDYILLVLTGAGIAQSV